MAAQVMALRWLMSQVLPVDEWIRVEQTDVRMQLHYLLVVVVVSDIKIMSSTVAVICTVNQLLSYYTSCKQLQYPNRTEYF